MNIIAGIVVRCAPKYVQLAVERNHGVTIASGGGRWTTPQDVLRADAGPCGRLEMELKEGVVFLCPRLTREDKHAVSCNSNGEVATGGRALPCLHHLLPLPPTCLPSDKVDCPHIVQPRIPVISCKYPQLPIVDCSTVGTSRHWFSTRRHPLRPLPSGKLVLPKVIPRDRTSEAQNTLIFFVLTGFSGLSCCGCHPYSLGTNKFTSIPMISTYLQKCTCCIRVQQPSDDTWKSKDENLEQCFQKKYQPWGRRSILRSRESSTPTLLFHIKPQQVIQHALAIVSAKNIDSVFVSDHGVL